MLSACQVSIISTATKGTQKATAILQLSHLNGKPFFSSATLCTCKLTFKLIHK